MSLSQRDRRDLRIILWVSVASALVSAIYGYALRGAAESEWRAALQGVVTSLLIATPILLIEIKRARMAGLRGIRRLPLALYFAVKVLFYVIVIIAGLALAQFIFFFDDPRGLGLGQVLRRSLGFSIGMAVVGNLVFDMGGLLGFGTLKNLLTGRYVRPRSEQRAFLLIDMRDSTGLAERLGPIRFHELLNAFFRDISDAALECDAEIHKYVGDEAILTWPDDGTIADGECLACPFIARDFIATHADAYRHRFGVVPEFRAALHRGEIVAGEIGDVRREIAYVGDTLNVTARLLDAAKASGHDVLVSKELLERTKLPAGLQVEKLPVLDMRGRAAPLAVAALTRLGA